MYLTSVWLTALYFIEETLFLLFYNRKTAYINPPVNLLEGVYSTSYLIFYYNQFELWPAVQKVREWLSYEK